VEDLDRLASEGSAELASMVLQELRLIAQVPSIVVIIEGVHHAGGVEEGQGAGASFPTQLTVNLVSRQAISWTNGERQATVCHAQASSLCDSHSRKTEDPGNPG